MMMEFKLPVPPSTNELFVYLSKTKRVPSKKYKVWRVFANLMLSTQKKATFRGPCVIEMTVPMNRRRDLDNFLKAPIDLLVSAGVIEDDRVIDSISIERDLECHKDVIWVSINGEAGAWAGYQDLPGREKGSGKETRSKGGHRRHREADKQSGGTGED